MSGDSYLGSDLGLLNGGGEMGRRMRALDWSAAGLGDPRQWPHSLKAVVRIMLTSRFAMWMAWGPDLIFFCNDAYLPTVGLKRDWVLGARSNEVFRRCRLGHLIAKVRCAGRCRARFSSISAVP